MSRKDKDGLIIKEGDYLLIDGNDIRIAVVYRDTEQDYESDIHYERIGFTDQSYDASEDEAYSAWDTYEDSEITKLTKEEVEKIIYK